MNGVGTRFLVHYVDQEGNKHYFGYSHKAGMRGPELHVVSNGAAEYPMTAQEALQAAENAILHVVGVKEVTIEPIKETSNG